MGHEPTEAAIAQIAVLAGQRPGTHSDTDLERLAHAVASLGDYDARTQAVQLAAKAITSTKPSLVAARLLSWLLVYGVVEPIQVLQAIVYTRDASLVDICGTTPFEADVLEHLNLPREAASVQPRFRLHKGRRVFVDLLGDTRGSAAMATASDPDTSSVTGAPPAKKPRPSSEPQSSAGPVRSSAKPNHAEYAGRLRAIIMSSMSAQEITFRLGRAFQKGTEEVVVGVLEKLSYTSKVYNRIYANVAVRLAKENPRAWPRALQTRLENLFLTDSERLSTDELRAVGTFYADLLAADAMDWSEAFSTLSLEPRVSTASNRILLLALLEELRKEVGTRAVEARMFAASMASSVSGMFETDLSSDFWQFAGYDSIAQRLESGDQ